MWMAYKNLAILFYRYFLYCQNQLLMLNTRQCGQNDFVWLNIQQGAIFLFVQVSCEKFWFEIIWTVTKLLSNINIWSEFIWINFNVQQLPIGFFLNMQWQVSFKSKNSLQF